MGNRYSKKKLGKVLESVGILGHSGPVLAANGAFETLMERATRVPERLKSLAEIKAAMMVGCPF